MITDKGDAKTFDYDGFKLRVQLENLHELKIAVY